MQQERVTEVSKWTLVNTNGCWSLSSTDKCCSKMVKLLNSDDCRSKNFKEDGACVSFLSDLKKVSGTEYYRIEMTTNSGNKKVYWHTANNMQAK